MTWRFRIEGACNKRGSSCIRANDIAILLTQKTVSLLRSAKASPSICKEGMVVDALATAVFVLGPEKGYALC
jgi:thiamine biosynthesis lipoprotein ApbE